MSGAASRIGALLLALAFAVFGTLAAPDRAAAGTLDSYRAEGVIAERFDGFVELKGGGAPAEAAGIVKDVNAERGKIYDQRAKESGVSPAEVGKLYATQIVEKAPKGTWFRRSDGSYVQK